MQLNVFVLIGIQKYGSGNWKEISAFMDSGKKEKQLDEHYWQLYMGKHGVCLPVEFSIDNFQTMKDTIDIFPESENGGEEGSDFPSKDDLFRIPLVPGYDRGQQVERDVLAPDAIPTSASASSVTASSGGRGGRAQGSQQAAQQLLQPDLPGYMPLREDFETEYENEAEQFLADMEFSSDDHPSEVELKLQVIRIYNHKLAERDKRKRFVLDRGLVDIKKHQQEEKKLTKEERDLVSKLRPFARYHSQEEHEALVKGILRAQRLRQQIELYKVYRQMGLTNLDEVLKYESDKKHKDQELRYKKERDGAAYVYENSRVQTGLSALGKRAAPDDLDGAQQQQSSEAVPRAGKGRGRRKSTADSAANGSSQVTTVSSESVADASADPSDAMEVSEQLLQTSTATPADPSFAWSTVPALVSVQDVRRAQGAHLLSELELQLCARVPLQPLVYLGIKDAIIAEAFGVGLLTLDGVRTRVGHALSGQQSALLFDFFVKEAHINEAVQQRNHNQQQQQLAAGQSASSNGGH